MRTLIISKASFVQSYRYDSLYRLTEAKEKTGTTDNWIQNWSYDRYGNRIGFSQNIAGNTNAPNPTVDANTNRFNSGQGFTYDKNGNVVGDVDAASSLSRTFVFNGDNKQTEVKKDGVTVGRYYYDGEGKRVKKVTDTETTVFVYSAGKLVAEYSTQISQTPTIAYTTTDHVGSPRIITDEVGQVKSRRDFMPFGEDIFVNVGARSESLQYGSTTDTIRKKFTGYEHDGETNLDFAEARMYANTYGRFTAVDPLLASGKSANPQTFNRFVYVGNNPIVVTDPTGLDWYSRYNKDSNRTEYQWFEGEAEKGWDPVDFGRLSNIYLRIDDVCITDKCDSSRYLNRYGGSLTPEEYAQRQEAASSRFNLGSFGLTNVYIPNLAVLPERWEGLKKGTWNFGAGIVNSPIEFPVFAGNLVSSQRSIGGMFGIKPFVEYSEYDNTVQRLQGFQTQGILTVASFALGQAPAASRAAQIGNKLEFTFGRSTGDLRNIKRSTTMQQQLGRIGIFDNNFGRTYVTKTFKDNFNSTAGMLQPNGRIVREGLITGPGGVLKFETVWERNKLITMNFFGKP